MSRNTRARCPQREQRGRAATANAPAMGKTNSEAKAMPSDIRNNTPRYFFFPPGFPLTLSRCFGIIFT